MNNILLFGLNITTLFSAIAQVESDRGATSDNVYQLRRIYIDDVNRIRGISGQQPIPYELVIHDKLLAEAAMITYWQYYGNVYLQRTGGPVSLQVLARMHNGGPDGYKKYATKRYWQRVKFWIDNFRQQKEWLAASKKGGAK